MLVHSQWPSFTVGFCYSLLALQQTSEEKIRRTALILASSYRRGTQVSAHSNRILCRMRYHCKMAHDVDRYSRAFLRILKGTNRKHARGGKCAFESEESLYEPTSVAISNGISDRTID